MLAGAFNVLVWPRFGLAVWRDDRAWSGAIGASTPTAFWWVHAVLVAAAVLLGLGVLVVGLRGLRTRA